MLSGLAIWFAQGVAAAVFAMIWGAPAGTEMTLRHLGLVCSGAYAVALTLFAALAIGLAPWTARTLGVRPTPNALCHSIVATALVLPIVAATGIALTLLWTALQDTPPPQVAHETLAKLAAGPSADPNPDNRGVWWWLVVGTVVIGAPIVEEIIYRGLLQTAISHVARSRWLAIAVTSAVFTVVHVGVADLRALPILFILSLGLGVSYERSGRLIVPIVVHMIFNAANVATAVLQNSS